MTDAMAWSVAPLLLLGAVHGVNPGMGWLFAVALGMQEQRGHAVWRALLPLAAGHALAILLAVVVATALGRLLPLDALRWAVALALIGVGVLRLVRHRHPRHGGMRVSFRTLTTWSFLMATAHGAGLMVLPVLLREGTMTASGAHLNHATMEMGVAGSQLAGLFATGVHTAGYLLVTGVIAVVVYERLGLRMLRRVWVNLDLVWAIALIGTGALGLVA